MFWQDILLSRLVGESELARAVAAAFGVTAERACVIGDVEEMRAAAPWGNSILVQRTMLEGEFPLQISIYLRDADLERRVAAPDATMDLVRRLCAELACDCLVSDEEISSETMLRVRRTGQVDAVILDADALDREQYVVVSSRPAAPRTWRVA